MEFEIPVVLFLFKRSETLEKIFSRLRTVAPRKVYLIADGPRNEVEKKQTELCRRYAENLITWDCEIIKHYAEENIGVYSNIGLGAKWVLEQEKWAIFLEDDNLPEISFFDYCEELLKKYENEEKIFWICGTNYLEKYNSEYSYVFTQHLLPCGWATWSSKYLKYYDGELELLTSTEHMDNFRSSYLDKRLYYQQLRSVKRTKMLLNENRRASSWDYQMLFSLRANNMYGIAPTVNLITNIGADAMSTHGGTSMRYIMTKRFCEVQSRKIEFPLYGPTQIALNKDYERVIGKIILYPLSDRIKIRIAAIVKRMIGLREEDSFKEYLQGLRYDKNKSR